MFLQCLYLTVNPRFKIIAKRACKILILSIMCYLWVTNFPIVTLFFCLFWVVVRGGGIVWLRPKSYISLMLYFWFLGNSQ